MRVLTLLRAAAWLGVGAAGWSLNLVWGEAPHLRGGPPIPWERHVVGAALLCGIGAAAISIAGRRGAPPRLVPKSIALSAAAAAAGIALYLLYDARSNPIRADRVSGDGWTWLIAGSALCLIAVAGVGLLRQPRELSRKSRGRKRGGAR